MTFDPHVSPVFSGIRRGASSLLRMIVAAQVRNVHGTLCWRCGRIFFSGFSRGDALLDREPQRLLARRDHFVLFVALNGGHIESAIVSAHVATWAATQYQRMTRPARSGRSASC